MSEITFSTSNGENITRQGNISAAQLIAQATSEFGEINVTASQDATTYEEGTTAKAQSISVLEAAKHNLRVCLDQLASLDEDNPMGDAKTAIEAAITGVNTELELLRAS